MALLILACQTCIRTKAIISGRAASDFRYHEKLTTLVEVLFDGSTTHFLKNILPHSASFGGGGAVSHSKAYFSIIMDNAYLNSTCAVSVKDIPSITPLIMDLPV